MERIKDYLLMEEEFIQNQERLKPREEKNEVCVRSTMSCNVAMVTDKQEERSKVDDIRGSPMAVGTLEEIIDENHAIVSTSVGSEYYVVIMTFVDKDLLEPGCTVLLNHKVCLCYLVVCYYYPSSCVTTTLVVCQHYPVVLVLLSFHSYTSAN